ncbi:hypothetical protein IWQ60_003627 [Tieghemiomyces parasiticus]|uniref:Uncharacterized protein n=1 Tax=Tieghemiomyces parasiticus TaxID=78921 RepID=A0A9W8AF84_9FUNG|nr:hypothetical protein IWQ60_003627 [Tieghemiomyces parasiticus]
MVSFRLAFVAAALATALVVSAQPAEHRAPALAKRAATTTSALPVPTGGTGLGGGSDGNGGGIGLGWGGKW